MKKIVLLLIIIISGVSASFAEETDSLYFQKADSASYFIDRKDWHNAERVLKEALRLEPARVTNALIHYNLAKVQQEEGKYHEALQSLDIAKAITPSNTTILNARAIMLSAFGRHKEAIEDFDVVIATRPDEVTPLLMRALSRLKTGEGDAAEEDLKKVLKLSPDNPEAHDALSTYYASKRLFPEAIEHSRRLVEKEPTAENHLRLGILQALNKEFEEAERTVSTGLKVDENYGDLYYLRAYIHQERLETEAKEADMRTASSKGGNLARFKSLLR